jgi:hypothetical protein
MKLDPRMAFLTLATLALTGQSVHADTGSLIDGGLVDQIRTWVQQPVTSITVTAQNRRHDELTAEQIIALDEKWRAERKAADQPLIAQIFGSPLSTYLTRVKANSNGLISELFVMDNRGLNVGISTVTSDYWQGDEAKWQKTFQVGPDAVFIDEPEYDADSRTHRVQINLTVNDPKTGQPIGAVTAEINLNELARLNGNVRAAN